MSVREYDPDADPLMGRLVSVRVDESAGGRWEDALVGYCETAIVGDEEVSTGLYRVLWGSFKSVDEALTTKRTRQKVRRATPPLAPRASRARVGTLPEFRGATLRRPSRHSRHLTMRRFAPRPRPRRSGPPRTSYSPSRRCSARERFVSWTRA